MTLSRYRNKDGASAPVFRNQIIFGKFLFYPFHISTWFINFIDGNDDINTCCFGMVDRFHSLRHHTVVCGNNQYGNIRSIGTTHTHGCKCLMTRCIKEGDLLSLDGYHISTDVLGDTAGLTVGYICLTDRIQKRGFTMINMTHNTDYRRSGNQCRLIVFFLFQQFLDHIDFLFLLCNDIEFHCNFLCLFKINFMIDCHHDALHKQFLHDHRRLHLHLFRQFTDGHFLRKDDFLYFFLLFLFRLRTNRFLKSFRKFLIRTASLIRATASLTSSSVLCLLLFSFPFFFFIFFFALDIPDRFSCKTEIHGIHRRCSGISAFIAASAVSGISVFSIPFSSVTVSLVTVHAAAVIIKFASFLTSILTVSELAIAAVRTSLSLRAVLSLRSSLTIVLAIPKSAVSALAFFSILTITSVLELFSALTIVLALAVKFAIAAIGILLLTGILRFRCCFCRSTLCVCCRCRFYCLCRFCRCLVLYFCCLFRLLFSCPLLRTISCRFIAAEILSFLGHGILRTEYLNQIRFLFRAIYSFFACCLIFFFSFGFILFISGKTFPDHFFIFFFQCTHMTFNFYIFPLQIF